jgi:ABC-type nitrate/sulfonate/bicarbonate transport system substrate-binding protein
MTRRSIVIVYLASLILAVPQLCAHATAENVKVGIPSLTVTMMPLAVAKEQGFFGREGLNVDMVLMPAALNMRVLLAGDIQYATTVGSAVVAAVRGINARVMMCFVDRPLLDLVSGPDINAIKDLKGKLVGISSRGGLHDVTMRRILMQSEWILRRQPSLLSAVRAPCSRPCSRGESPPDCSTRRIILWRIAMD